MPFVLVVGSINMDLVVRAPVIPRPGQNVFGEDLRIVPGGKGANQAVGIARLGYGALLSGRVGEDSFGHGLLQNLQENQVDISHIERDAQASTGVAIITIDATGENSIVIATGANGRFSMESAGGLRSAIADADLVLLQLELPPGPVAEVIDMARGMGKPVILDAGPPCKAPLPSFFSVTVLTPNREEAEALTGQSIRDMESTREVGRCLLGKGPEAVILKLGGEGALLFTVDKERCFPAHEVDVVDTTGAGDAFTAALAVALAEKEGYEEAVEFANAAGALAVTKLGAQSALPTREELERFLSCRRERA